MDHQNLEEQDSHPRDNSIPSEAKEENSKSGEQEYDQEIRHPSDNFTWKTKLSILAIMLGASIVNSDIRSAVLDPIIGYVIVDALDCLRKTIKK